MIEILNDFKWLKYQKFSSDWNIERFQMIEILKDFKWLKYWKISSDWNIERFQMIEMLKDLKWSMFWISNDWNIKRFQMIEILKDFKWLKYWKISNDWNIERFQIIDVLDFRLNFSMISFYLWLYHICNSKKFKENFCLHIIEQNKDIKSSETPTNYRNHTKKNWEKDNKKINKV